MICGECQLTPGCPNRRCSISDLVSFPWKETLVGMSTADGFKCSSRGCDYCRQEKTMVGLILTTSGFYTTCTDFSLNFNHTSIAEPEAHDIGLRGP